METAAASVDSPVWMLLESYLSGVLAVFDAPRATAKWNELDRYLNVMTQEGDIRTMHDPLFTFVRARPDVKSRKYHRAVVSGYDSESAYTFRLVWHPSSGMVTPGDVTPALLEYDPSAPVSTAARCVAARVTSSPADLEHYVNPTSFKHSRFYPDVASWDDAIAVCFDNFERLDAFDVVTSCPPGVRPIGTKFVFKLKMSWDAALGCSVIEKYRVRLVALGFLQEFGVNYEGSYAPTAQLCTTRLVLNEAVQYGLHVFNMDVRSAFLNSKIQYDLWIRMPTGFTYQGLDVVKLKNTLEGTKQGAHDWYNTQHAFLAERFPHLTRHPLDPCFYFSIQGTDRVYLVLHTDDYLMACSDPKFYRDFFVTYNSVFPSNDMGVLRRFLGVDFSRDWENQTLSMSQQGFIQQLVVQFGLTDASSKSSPMVPGLSLPFDQECDMSLPYLSLLGGLAWVTRITRPDALYAVLYHSQFSGCYTSVHFTSLKRVLLYLKGTLTWSVTYRKSCDTAAPRIQLYTDTDWAGCKHDRRSHQGSLGTIDCNPVGWWCTKQRVVALSSMEAELIGTCSATRNGQYLLQLLQPLAETTLTPMPLYGDNRAAFIFSNKQQLNEKTKHIEIAYFYTRDKIADGTIYTCSISTIYNLADLFTKGLTGERTQWLGQALLGMAIIKAAETANFRPHTKSSTNT